MVVITVSSNLFQGILQSAIAKTLKQTTGEGSTDSGDSAEGAGSGGEGGDASADIEHNIHHNKAYITSSVHASSTHRHTSYLARSAHRLYTTIAAYTTKTNINSSTATSKANNAGAVFGLSASADRAARVISPLLGGFLIHHFHTTGLVFLVSCSVSYGLYLLSSGASGGVKSMSTSIGIISINSLYRVYGAGKGVLNSVMYGAVGVLRSLRSKPYTEVAAHVEKREHEKYL